MVCGYHGLRLLVSVCPAVPDGLMQMLVWLALARWLSWLERHLVNQKGPGFGSQSGQIPRLRVQSLVRVHMGGS